MPPLIWPRACRYCGTTENLKRQAGLPGGVATLCKVCQKITAKPFMHWKKEQKKRAQKRRYYKLAAPIMCTVCRRVSLNPNCWKCQGLPKNPRSRRGHNLKAKV